MIRIAGYIVACVMFLSCAGNTHITGRVTGKRHIGACEARRYDPVIHQYMDRPARGSYALRIPSRGWIQVDAATYKTTCVGEQVVLRVR